MSSHSSKSAAGLATAPSASLQGSARVASPNVTLRITLVKSPTGYNERQKRTVRALGLRRLNQTVEQADTPVVRGMIAKVPHLVSVEEVQ